MSARRPTLRVVSLGCLIIGASGLSACNEASFFVKPDVEARGPQPGSISGRVCDPSGRTWLSDATVYTHLIDGAGSLYDTRTVYTDRDGKWTLEELPPEVTYDVYVQYGDEVIDFFAVEVEDSAAVVLEDPDCFDPLALDVAVVTGDYDSFDVVLDNMGFANYTLVDGLSEADLADFLGDVEAMKAYDIIFFNGGHIEDGIVYGLDGVTADPVLMANVVEYVEGGGAIYASDWAYDVVETGWPDRVDFVGDDETPDAAQVGEYGVVQATVADAALAEWLGAETMSIEYDLPVWPPIESVDPSVTSHLQGGVSYRVGTETYNLADVPLLVSYTAGEGKVVFSTFRVAKNGTSEMLEVLQYIMYNL
jgi:hypothetical protein